MRATGDHRPDYQVKADILAQIEEQSFSPVFAIDDRTQVVDMWRAHGIRTLQCAKGDY